MIAHNTYGAMTGGSTGHIGGVERQTSMMARWLAGRGWRVSLLTWDEGGPAEEVIDGVRVIKMCRRDAGTPGLRFFWPRWTSLNAAMRKADADVYYQNCAEYVTGQVAMWCGRNGRRFAYSVASDPDVDVCLPRMRRLRERALYRYGLRHADRVIVQTASQQSRLRIGFGVESTVIPMPCFAPASGADLLERVPSNGDRRILWVGRLCEDKRPDRLVELAESCPDRRFDLVGPTQGSRYGEDMLARARKLSNITVHGGVARDRMPEFYRKAACLLCTSDIEGFPNTFLEAWSHGLPVVSTFDPDNLIAERSLGVAARDAAGLAAGLQDLLASPDVWRRASQNARRYYLENHTIEAAMPRFERVFLDVAASRKS